MDNQQGKKTQLLAINLGFYPLYHIVFIGAVDEKLMTQGNLINMIQVQLMRQTSYFDFQVASMFFLVAGTFSTRTKNNYLHVAQNFFMESMGQQINEALKEFNPKTIKSEMDITLSAFSFYLKMGVAVLVHLQSMM